MSINGLYNNQIRLSGLATGLDTDRMVTDLMRVEMLSYDRLFQQKQLQEWKRDEYRNTTSLMQKLKSDYFDFLKPSNNMLSQSTYKAMSINISDSLTGLESQAVDVTADHSAMQLTHTVEVQALATAERLNGITGVTKLITSTPASLDLAGEKINVTLDGTTKTITLDDYTDINELSIDLQSKIDTAYGSGKITVGADVTDITFDTIGGSNKLNITKHQESDAFDLLGFSGVVSNRLRTGESLENLSNSLDQPFAFDVNDQLLISINGQEFEFDKTETLSSIISEINADPNANVIMRYEETSDRFIITSKQTGEGQNIVLEQQSGNFFDALKISTDPVDTIEGQDAVAIIDGTNVVRSNNSFTISGVTYTLKTETVNALNVSVNLNTDEVVDKITKFVESYNELIDTFNSKISEEYDRSYKPLTNEQKEQMNEKDIEKWEEKAKTGLLRNDSILQNIVYEMRKALYDPVEGEEISLSSIGITTGSYSQKGKLVINENKLREAVSQSPESVMNLFTKESEIDYKDGLNRQTRYEENGLAYRISDILDDNIRITRDSNGRKGILLEKAGMIGDLTEYTNTMSKSISNLDISMHDMLQKLAAKEEGYYRKFANLEKVISQMNSQMDWLMQQTSSM